LLYRFESRNLVTYDFRCDANLNQEQQQHHQHQQVKRRFLDNCAHAIFIEAAILFMTANGVFILIAVLQETA
jgi:hypothetical protein